VHIHKTLYHQAIWAFKKNQLSEKCSKLRKNRLTNF